MQGAGPYETHGVLVGSGKRNEPLQPHQVNEAGYLAARASMGSPIDNEKGDLKRLIDANETVHETRTHLNGGRGNVGTDILATSGANGQLVAAIRHEGLNPSKHGAGSNDVMAGASLAVGVGNCGEYSMVATRLHGPKLQPGEAVSRVSSTSFDHGWTEVHTPSSATVVLDAWAKGPAMQASDTAWRTPGRLDIYPSAPGAAPADTGTDGAVRKLESIHDAESGKASRGTMFRLASYFSHGPGRAHLDQAITNSHRVSPLELAFALAPPLAGSLDPRVPGFGQKARDSMQSQTPLHQEVLAVGAMREGYQMNVATAAAQAQSVLQAGQTLDTMLERQARPPLEDPRPEWIPPIRVAPT